MDPNLSNSNSSAIKSIALVVPLVCVAALGNWFITFALQGSRDEIAYCFFLGMLLAQTCLLSIWCASVKQRLILRVSLSLGILFSLSCCFVMAIRKLLDIPGGPDFPLEIPLVCFGIVVGLGLMIQIPLLLLRRYTNRAISIGQPHPMATSENQFGIKHVLIATTIVALILGLGQVVFANLQFKGEARWGEIVMFLMSLAVLTSIICWLSIGFVFLNQTRIATGITLVLAVFLGSGMVCGILVYAGGFPDPVNVYFNTAAYAIGLAVTINVVLVSFYAIGYRMNRLDPNR